MTRTPHSGRAQQTQEEGRGAPGGRGVHGRRGRAAHVELLPRSRIIGSVFEHLFTNSAPIQATPCHGPAAAQPGLISLCILVISELVFSVSLKLKL